MSNFEELVKGKTYWINFDDCCARGAFKGKFRSFVLNEQHSDDNGSTSKFFDTLPENYEDIDEFPELHFDTGYVEWDQAISFTEIDESPYIEERSL